MTVASLYPNDIDKMLFFQDNDINAVGVLNTYHNLIAQGKYTEAGNYIGMHKEIYGLFPDYLNALENRIYNLQEYLLTKQKKNPFVLSDSEPKSVAEGTIWI
ncbi:MAG: hypothetical protein NC251_04230 [Lachnoclostridium sp.]|nr:hypothetical protein [Lachnospira sp.]MCM1247620.1 hypothetical protein [Lachnoclostridium sp.]